MIPFFDTSRVIRKDFFDPETAINDEKGFARRGQGTKLRAMRRIDCHVHLVGDGSAGTGCWIRTPNPARLLAARFLVRAAGLPRAVLKSGLDDAYAESLVRRVRESSLDAVVLLAMDLPYSDTGEALERKATFYVPNERVLDLGARHPEIIPACSIHPAWIPHCWMGNRHNYWNPRSAIIYRLACRILSYCRSFSVPVRPSLNICRIVSPKSSFNFPMHQFVWRNAFSIQGMTLADYWPRFCWTGCMRRWKKLLSLNRWSPWSIMVHRCLK